MADLLDLQRLLARPAGSPSREEQRPQEPPGSAVGWSLEGRREQAVERPHGHPDELAVTAVELPPDPGSFELAAPVDFLDAARAADGTPEVEIDAGELDPDARVDAPVELPPDPGAFELAPPVDFLDAALAALVETEVEVDLEDVHLEAGRDAIADAPPPVPIHRFPDSRRNRTGRPGPSRTIGGPTVAAEAGFPPPAPAWKESAVMRGPTRPTDRPAEPEPAPPASSATPPTPVADDELLVVDETPGPASEPAHQAAKLPAAPAPMPPPLPKSEPGERLALPGSASDFELFAPAPLGEPEEPFTGTAGAWSAAVSGIRREPIARIAPARPPPPVLPQVTLAGKPPSLARLAPAEPPVTSAPVDEEARPTEAPVTRIDLDPEQVDPDEPTFAPGPPSIAEDLYGGAVLRPRVSGERQVVLHTREGQALRGSLRDAELDGPILPLETRGGTVRVPVDRIRAVFFIVPIGDPLPEPQGRQARVVFEDGRPVAGLVAEYRHDATGFFLMPLDGRGRTERIFVYRDAIRSIQFVD